MKEINVIPMIVEMDTELLYTQFLSKDSETILFYEIIEYLNEINNYVTIDTEIPFIVKYGQMLPAGDERNE